MRHLRAAGGAVPAGGRQPDLGTALVLVPVLAAILVGIGMRLKVLGRAALAGVAAMPLAWFVLKPYQRDRLLVYLDPFRDPLGTAYNVIQAKIAIGSGQLLGKGIRRRDAEPPARFSPSGTLISFLPCSPRCGGSSVVSC